jgi:hypothetical protein
MKKKLLAGLAIGIFMFCAVGFAQATTITSLVGDKDGYGLGVSVGNYLDWSAVGAGDGDGTDVWMYGSQSWAHTYDISSISIFDDITLEIVSAGSGTVNGPATLSLNGTVIGSLSGGSNNSYLDTFNLLSFSSLFDGSDTLSVSLTGGDGWALDYSELSFSGTAPVPEPATMLLFSTGLAGLMGNRIRRKKR